MEQLKGYTKGYYVSAVAAVFLGVALLVWPETSMQTFCYAFGGVAIIFGLVKMVMYFMRDRMESLMEPDLIIGITATAFGGYVLIKSEFVISLLPFIAGVYLLLGGVIKLQGALDMKRLSFRAWWLILIIAIAMFGLGGFLVANPIEEKTRIVMILIGTGLTVDGATNLFDMFMINHLYKKARLRNQKPQPEHVVDAEEIYEGSIQEEASVRAEEAASAEGSGKLPSILRRKKKDRVWK